MGVVSHFYITYIITSHPLPCVNASYHRTLCTAEICLENLGLKAIGKSRLCELKYSGSVTITGVLQPNCGQLNGSIRHSNVY